MVKLSLIISPGKPLICISTALIILILEPLRLNQQPGLGQNAFTLATISFASKFQSILDSVFLIFFAYVAFF